MTCKVSVMNEEFVMAVCCGLRRAKDRSIFAARQRQQQQITMHIKKELFQPKSLPIEDS